MVSSGHWLQGLLFQWAGWSCPVALGVLLHSTTWRPGWTGSTAWHSTGLDFYVDHQPTSVQQFASQGHHSLWSIYSLPFPKILQITGCITDIWALQALSTRPNSADMVYSRSLTPWIKCLLHSSRYIVQYVTYNFSYVSQNRITE